MFLFIPLLGSALGTGAEPTPLRKQRAFIPLRIRPQALQKQLTRFSEKVIEMGATSLQDTKLEIDEGVGQ